MLFAAANVTVSCQQGTNKYLLETVGKGFYEVIGTLQAGGNITEMNTVFMGENFGQPATVRPPPRLARVNRLTPCSLRVCRHRHRHVRADGQADARAPRHLLNAPAHRRRCVASSEDEGGYSSCVLAESVGPFAPFGAWRAPPGRELDCRALASPSGAAVRERGRAR